MAKSCGLKKQIRQVNPKMSLIGGPNMALGKSGIKRPRLVSFVRGSKNRREREGRAKEEKRRRRREDQEVWNFDFWYGN